MFRQQTQGDGEDWSSFLDRLRARLGEQAIRRRMQLLLERLDPQALRPSLASLSKVLPIELEQALFQVAVSIATRLQFFHFLAISRFIS